MIEATLMVKYALLERENRDLRMRLEACNAILAKVPQEASELFIAAKKAEIWRDDE